MEKKYFSLSDLLRSRLENPPKLKINNLGGSQELSFVYLLLLNLLILLIPCGLFDNFTLLGGCNQSPFFFRFMFNQF